MWLAGNYFYSIAIPTAIMSAFIYFVSFKQLYQSPLLGCRDADEEMYGLETEMDPAKP